MPDYSSDLFFLQTTILTLIGPLSKSFTIRKPTKAKHGPGKLANLVQRVPFLILLFQGNIQNRTCLKGPPFGFFSTLCEFFSNFFCLQRVPPFIFYFFNVTYKTGRASRVPSLDLFSALCDFFLKIS